VTPKGHEKEMKMFEIFDGKRYLLSVMPSENPRNVLNEERSMRRNYRLSMVMVENGVRTLVEGPGAPEVIDEDDILYEDEAENEE